MAIREFKTPSTIDEAVNLAAEFLPESFSIGFDIERNGYACELVLPNGETFPCSDTDSVQGCIITALNLAVRIDAQQGAGV